jgi:CelD/BcsL family acetyltransferase involved in cellulose biosynthesis
MSASYRLIGADQLDATLLGAWRAIQSRRGIFASPFVCPEFVQAVASVREDVRIVVIENAGRPAGFFPHQRADWARGRPVAGALSDYHGVLAEEGSEWSVVELMRVARLAVWSFDHLVDDSGRFDPYVTARTTSPQIDLHAGFAAPLEFERKARKLARELGELRFSLHEPGGGVLEQLLKWKSAQYRRTGLTDAFGVGWTAALLRRIMALQSEAFAGVCSVLRAGDEIVALHAGMRSREVLHWWFPSYDQRFARYSPGILLLLRLAQAAAAAGIGTIDLGKGDSRYKRSLMNRAAELREGFVEIPSLIAQARRLRRVAEARAAAGGVATMLRLPLRLMGRLERVRRYQ